MWVNYVGTVAELLIPPLTPIKFGFIEGIFCAIQCKECIDTLIVLSLLQDSYQKICWTNVIM